MHADSWNAEKIQLVCGMLLDIFENVDQVWTIK
jgi:hypothetical protein